MFSALLCQVLAVVAPRSGESGSGDLRDPLILVMGALLVCRLFTPKRRRQGAGGRV